MKLQEALRQVDTLRAELAALRPLNAGELARLREQFAIENTYNSNAIEGNTLTLRETALILQEGITIAEKPLKDHLEAIGHRDAFRYIVELADKESPLTERTVKDIHTLVLMNDAENKGVYRRMPVQIVGAAHTPPQPYLVPVQMEQLLADYEKQAGQRHTVEAVADFHLRFEGIHPFIDGNGRTGRLLLNLELMKAGLLPVNVKYADRRRYYDCFDDYHAGSGTADMFTAMIAEYEREELARYIAAIKGIGSGDTPGGE